MIKRFRNGIISIQRILLFRFYYIFLWHIFLAWFIVMCFSYICDLLSLNFASTVSFYSVWPFLVKKSIASYFFFKSIPLHLKKIVLLLKIMCFSYICDLLRLNFASTVSFYSAWPFLVKKSIASYVFFLIHSISF